MLRYDFLPSDFHPQVLFIGYADDLASFAEMLRGFSAAPREIAFDALPFCAPSDTVLRLAPSGEAGMRVMDQKTKALRWTLNAWQAERIAERIDVLAEPGNEAGSDIIELGVPGEIPVKISRGEFTDDFLLPLEAAAGG